LGRIEETFQRRISVLPADARRLLVLAAADPLGDPLLVWRAADELGIERPAADPAVDAGLVEFGARVRFRHPLVHSVSSHSELTAQEAQVAKLAREGLSNPEIGARLYISSRAAGYHLSKVFAKLGITSRAQLESVLT
jgi:DNA-binding CsgD family transcriptional regulator